MTGNRDVAELIKALEAEYNLDNGFLGQLRQGFFDASGLDRLIAILASIEPTNESTIDRRLVALLWMIPTLMSWQVPRVADRGGNVVQLQHGIDKVEEILMNSVLGTP